MKRPTGAIYAPYLELTLVFWLNRPRCVRRNWLREFGIFGPVASVEGVSIVVFEKLKAMVDLSNKDRPTVYQKRSRLRIRNDVYNR